MHAPLRLLLTIPLAAALTACTSPQRNPAAADSPSSSASVSVDPSRFVLRDGRTGHALTWHEAIARAAAADAVLLGELHDPGPAQAVHGPFFSGVLAAAPAAAAALEFYERDDQAHIDDYLAGITTYAQLAQAALGSARNDLQGHREILAASRDAGRPVIAANAPRRYVSLARREGFDRLATLTAEQRRLFALPVVTPSERYRADFFAEMNLDLNASPAPATDQIERIDAVFRSQTLWDATMADSVARALDTGARPVILVVGRFHTDFDGGLTQQLRALRPGIRTCTLSISRGAPPAASPSPADTDRGRADILIYAPDPNPPRACPLPTPPPILPPSKSPMTDPSSSSTASATSAPASSAL